MEYNGEALHPGRVEFARIKPNLFRTTVCIGTEEIVYYRTLAEYAADLQSAVAAYKSEPEEPA